MYFLRRVLTRSIYTTTHVLYPETSTIRKTKTKKKLYDLPDTFTGKDGSPAGPLDPLHNPTVTSPIPIVKTRRRVISKKVNVDAGVSIHVPLDPPILLDPKTPLAKSVLANLEKFPDCLLLTRVGNFYESYFSPQPAEIAALLGIKLATRVWGGNEIDMCGFPLAHLNKYLKILVQTHGRKVALCEEFATNNLDDGSLFERRVNRIITPGTLIDEDFLSSDENNYLLAIGTQDGEDNTVGLAWVDVSTGEYHVKTILAKDIRDELFCISPREVVLENRYKSTPNHSFIEAIQENSRVVISYLTPQCEEPLPNEHNEGVDGLKDPSIIKKAHILASYTPEERVATSVLDAFLKHTLREFLPEFAPPTHNRTDQTMRIDTFTMRALEIKQRMDDGKTRGSLSAVIKRTVTAGGSRMLLKWLAKPSTSLVEINRRLSVVALFIKNPSLCSDIVHQLQAIEDLERVVQRFLCKRASITDVMAFERTIRAIRSIQSRIMLEKEGLPDVESSTDWQPMIHLLGRLKDLSSLEAYISSALIDKGEENATPIKSILAEEFGLDDEWTINPQFLPELKESRDALDKLLANAETLRTTLRKKYRAPSLSLNLSSRKGATISVSRATETRHILKNNMITHLRAKEFGHPDWTLLAFEISERQATIAKLERTAFNLIHEKILAETLDIQQNAQICQELDVLSSFAVLAREMNFVQPTLTEDESYYVIDGRHPTVERGLMQRGRPFKANSISMAPPSSSFPSSRKNLHIITGPNMGGKSTILRQTALIALLAQTGSFVPADVAHIGIVDQVFARVGATDDLFHNRSTFMVEMLETAEILNKATSRSLVIMDEVGRGTTMTDGLALAYATLHQLSTVNKCRTLFATHFHELADMVQDPENVGSFPGVAFYHTDITKTLNSATYSYKLKPGVSRDSHGLLVASLASMPLSALAVAQRTWDKLKESSRSKT